MSKPKIFCLSTSLNIGGAEKFLTTVVEKLGHRYDFTVGYLKDRGYYGKYLSDEKGIKVIKFNCPWSLKNYLLENDFRILHTFLYRANIFGRFSGKLAGSPHIISTQLAIDKWKRWYYVLLDRWTARWCSTIIANSESAKMTLICREKIPAKKIKVIYNGLDFDKIIAVKPSEEIRKEFGLNESEPVIICVTRLHYEKGTDLLPSIASKVKNGIFLIVGDGPQRNKLEVVVRERGLSDRFRILGWRKDVLALLKISDIFLLPSREESFSQALLEAFSAGLPAVVSNVGGIKELVEDGKTGFLIKPGALDDFSGKINFLIENPSEAKKMGTAGFEKAKDFSEDKMIAAVDTLYDDLLVLKR